jgi:hypothetical protein
MRKTQRLRAALWWITSAAFVREFAQGAFRGLMTFCKARQEEAAILSLSNI